MRARHDVICCVDAKLGQILDIKSTHDTSFNVNGFLFIAGERSFTELVSFSFHEYQVSNP